jgi:protein phosphatase
MEVAGLSDVGCQRENNEDRYSYWEPAGDAEFQRKGRLLIVADGMGGYEGGQEASRIAVETIEQFYAESAGADPQPVLLDALEAAHRRILAHAGAHPALHGMGTTCTAVVLLNDRLYYAHIGDSRLYRVRNGSLSRLTHDHSYVGRLVATGVISSAEAESHPQRHILTAALGAGNEISPDSPLQPVALEAGDIFLLCTDGLWGVVPEDEILTASAGEPEDVCRELVQSAKDRGGPDNITLQVVHVSATGN